MTWSTEPLHDGHPHTAPWTPRYYLYRCRSGTASTPIKSMRLYNKVLLLSSWLRINLERLKESVISYSDIPSRLFTWFRYLESENVEVERHHVSLQVARIECMPGLWHTNLQTALALLGSNGLVVWPDRTKGPLVEARVTFIPPNRTSLVCCFSPGLHTHIHIPCYPLILSAAGRGSTG